MKIQNIQKLELKSNEKLQKLEIHFISTKYILYRDSVKYCDIDIFLYNVQSLNVMFNVSRLHSYQDNLPGYIECVQLLILQSVFE